MTEQQSDPIPGEVMAGFIGCGVLLAGLAGLLYVAYRLGVAHG